MPEENETGTFSTGADAPGRQAEPPKRPHPVSRARGVVNVVLFIAAGLTLLGWLNIALNVGHWTEARLAQLAALVAYAAFLALIALIASFVLIVIENRVVPDREVDGP